jgi:hypothetical protein
MHKRKYRVSMILRREDPGLHAWISRSQCLLAKRRAEFIAGGKAGKPFGIESFHH